MLMQWDGFSSNLGFHLLILGEMCFTICMVGVFHEMRSNTSILGEIKVRLSGLSRSQTCAANDALSFCEAGEKNVDASIAVELNFSDATENTGYLYHYIK